MPKDFFPDSAGDILGWCQALIRNLSPDPQSFGVPQDLFDPYVQTVSDFALAIMATANPNTRTRLQVIRRDQLKTRVELASREIARLIVAQPALSIEDRVLLGLGEPKQRVRRVVVPDTKPSIELQPMSDRLVNLRLLKSTAPFRGRAPGAAGALIFYLAAPHPTPGLDNWTFFDVTTKTRLIVELPLTIASGSVVWFKSCWINARFARGPMSTAVQTHVFGTNAVPTIQKIAA